MQNIFVPLDFSDNSLLALQHAIELAKVSDSKIIIFHSYLPPQMGGGSFTGRKKLTEIGKQEAEDNMYEVVSGLNQEEADLDFEHIIVEGDPLSRLLANAEKYEADLIVMGTKGASGLSEIFLGSVAAKVIADSKCPVVVVPEGSSTSSYERIVYGVSMLPEDENVLNYLKVLARDLKTKLEAIHIEKDQETTLAYERFILDYKQQTEANKAIKFDRISLDTNQKVEDALLEYVNSNPKTLLVMLRRNRRNFWERLFGTSVTKQLAYHAKSPLLILKAGNVE